MIGFAIIPPVAISICWRLLVLLVVNSCHCEGGGKDNGDWFCRYTPRGNLYGIYEIASASINGFPKSLTCLPSPRNDHSNLSLRGGIGKIMVIGFVLIPPVAISCMLEIEKAYLTIFPKV